MTQYYRIQPDLTGYMHFALDTYDFLDKLGEELELSDFGKPLQHLWRPVKGTYTVKAPGVTTMPDLFTWHTDMLVLSEKARVELEDILLAWGELLPLEVESGTIYLFNMLKRLPEDVIDMENSEYEYFEDEPVGLRVLNFDAAKVPQDSLIFGVQNNFAYNLYCDDRLKNLLTEKRLGGLVFNPVLIDPLLKK